MTPKAKAIELRERFYQASLLTIAGTATIFYQSAKKLAIIAVDEVIEQYPEKDIIEGQGERYMVTNDRWAWWNKVRAEIEKLQ